MRMGGKWSTVIHFPWQDHLSHRRMLNLGHTSSKEFLWKCTQRLKSICSLALQCELYNSLCSTWAFSPHSLLQSSSLLSTDASKSDSVGCPLAVWRSTLHLWIMIQAVCKIDFPIWLLSWNTGGRRRQKWRLKCKSLFRKESSEAVIYALWPERSWLFGGACWSTLRKMFLGLQRNVMHVCVCVGGGRGGIYFLFE